MPEYCRKVCWRCRTRTNVRLDRRPFAASVAATFTITLKTNPTRASPMKVTSPHCRYFNRSAMSLVFADGRWPDVAVSGFLFVVPSAVVRPMYRVRGS